MSNLRASSPGSSSSVTLVRTKVDRKVKWIWWLFSTLFWVLYSTAQYCLIRAFTSAFILLGESILNLIRGAFRNSLPWGVFTIIRLSITNSAPLQYTFDTILVYHSLTHWSTFLDEGWRQQKTTPISFFSIVLDLVTSPLAECDISFSENVKSVRFKTKGKN